MQEHGHEVVANAVALLLDDGESDMLTAFDAEIDESLREHCDFNLQGDGIRVTVCSHVMTLGTALRALRLVSVSKEVALCLHEADCLDWLRILLDVGCTILGGKVDSPDTKGVVAFERELLWLLEAAVGIVHSILWQLAQSELSEYHETALFETLARLAIALPCFPAVCFNVTSWMSSHESFASPKCGSTAEGVNALDVVLMQTLALFWEGRWASRVPQLLTRMANFGPSESAGTALLLARSMPPPLPVAPEQLPKAALLISPPSSRPLQPYPTARTVAEVTPVTLLAGGAAEDDIDASAAINIPFGTDAVQHALLNALQVRRDRWRSTLLEATSAVRHLVMQLIGSSCRIAVLGLVALLERLADLLPCSSAQELIIQPLLEQQAALGRCVADDECDRPATARGAPLAASTRMALVVAALAAQPAGRAALLSSDSALLGAALLSPLQAEDKLSRRAGLLLLHAACSHHLSLAAYQADEQASDDLPGLMVLGPVVKAVASLAEDEAAGLVKQARRVLKHLQITFMMAKKQPVRELGQALAAPDPVAALHAMSADFTMVQEAAEPDAKAGEDAEASRVAVWPHAWHAEECLLAELAELFASNDLFGTGLVSTALELVHTFQSEVPSKRQRTEVEASLNDKGDAPPPVRSGRGRIREENPPPRGKANTSRPASKHVDDFSGQMGVKRFQNSSRAPSKHVDDYQSAPVVRKTIPVEGPSAGDGQQAPQQLGDTAPCPTAATCAGGAMRGTFAGAGGPTSGGMPMCGQMNMQMLQQQLGMAAQGVVVTLCFNE